MFGPSRFVFNGKKFEETYGVELLKASKLFHATNLDPRYLEAIRLLTIPDSGNTLDISGKGVLTLFHFVVGKTPSAQCEMYSNPSAANGYFEVNELKKLDNEQINDNAIFLDLSLIEILHALLTLLLTKEPIFSEQEIAQVRDRLMFHAFFRASRFDLIQQLPSDISNFSILDRVGFSQNVIARLLVPIQYIVQHETAHWVYSSMSQDFDIHKEHPFLKEALSEAFDQALKKTTNYRKKIYGLENANYAANETAKQLKYWLSDGWEEVLCDFHGFKAAMLLANQAKVPISSVLVTVNILQMLISGLSMLVKEAGGKGKDVPALSARSLLIHAFGNVILHGYPSEARELAARMHSSANKRFITQVLQPCLDQLALMSEKPSNSQLKNNRRQILRQYGYDRYSSCKLAIVA